MMRAVDTVCIICCACRSLLTVRLFVQQYLVESIRRFPQPADFSRMIREAGFSSVTHRGLTHGVVNIHSGFKL